MQGNLSEKTCLGNLSMKRACPPNERWSCLQQRKCESSPPLHPYLCSAAMREHKRES